MASSEGSNTGRSGKALAAFNLSRGLNVSHHKISRPLISKAQQMHDTRDDEMFPGLRI